GVEVPLRTADGAEGEFHGSEEIRLQVWHGQMWHGRLARGERENTGGSPVPRARAGMCHWLRFALSPRGTGFQPVSATVARVANPCHDAVGFDLRFRVFRCTTLRGVAARCMAVRDDR